MLDDNTLLAGLRGDRTVEAICAETGLRAEDLATARDAFLARAATLRDETLQAAVHGTVEIIRDGAGIAHIFAGHTHDVYFGLGLAMAQDRLWQMDRLRRRAMGRQAEILGRSYLAADLAHRTVGIPEIAEREVALTDDATRALVEAFVAGINRGIAAFGTALPVEFRLLDYAPEAFTVRDVIAIARGFWWSLNGRIDRLIAAEASRLLPEALRTAYLTPEASENLVLPGADLGAAATAAGTDDATGSNNWALSGDRTTAGFPIVAGDPHQPFWIPSSWYEFALHGPEDDAAGCGHPGIPGLWYGSNGQSAWALTNNMASTRDMYREDIDPADPQRYRDGDIWRNFTMREVSIAVRGGAAETFIVRATVRGPIANALVPALAEGGDAPMSLRWVGMEHMDDLRALIGLARSKSWDAFRDVLRDWSVAVFNWIYADRSGHIGYQMAGRIPLRGRVWPGVRDANHPDDAWQGFIPFAGMPTRSDPQCGRLSSANQRIVGADYPYPIYGAYSQGHRGVRLDQVFDATPKLDVAANIAVQNDIVNVRAERNVPHILRALAGQTDAAVLECAAILRNWDARTTLDAIGPTLFETFMALWNREVLGRHLPERLLDLTVQQTGLCVAVLSGEVEDSGPEPHAARIARIARASVAALAARLGPNRDAWRWGQVHVAHWRHPLSQPAFAAAFDIGPAPVDGGSHTLRNTGGELPPHAAVSGAEYRIVVDFATPGSFLAVQNIGNSGVPGSKFYRDQFDPWRMGTYHQVHLSRAAVSREAVTTTTLIPSGG